MKAWGCCYENVQSAKDAKGGGTGFWRSGQGWRQHLCCGLGLRNWMMFLGPGQQQGYRKGEVDTGARLPWGSGREGKKGQAGGRRRCWERVEVESEQDKGVMVEGSWGTRANGGKRGGGRIKVVRTLAIVILLQSTTPKNSASRSRVSLFVMW